MNILPTEGCATDNIKSNQYSTTFEDQNNHILLSVDKTFDIKYGSCFKVENITPITNKLDNDSSFDYQQYMKSKQIIYQADGGDYIYTKHGFKYSLKNIRSKLITRNCNLSTELCPYINTLILGSKDIDDNYTRIYGRIGIAPLFAISGMHITLIYQFVIYWLSKMRVIISKANLIAITLLVIYSLLAGSSVAVNRALMMIIFRNGLKLQTKIAFIITLLIAMYSNPFNLLAAGFRLSYLITAVIIFIPRPKFTSEILSGLYLSTLCYLIAMPLSYGFNYTFNLLSPVAILIFTPIVTIVLMPLAIIVMLVPFQVIININLVLYHTVNSLAILFDQVTVVSGHISMVIWIVGAGIVFAIVTRSYKYFGLMIIWFVVVGQDINLFPTITFIDVGQGDSAIIETSNYNIMIDAGNNSSEVINLLNYLGIGKIDYLLISHAHLDHYGSVPDISRELPIGTVLELSNNQIITGSKGINQVIDGGWYTIIPYYGSNDNDRELVIRFNYNGYSILFPGDVELESEQYLVDNYCKLLDSTIIKVPHHGSRTSSSDQFISCVSPQVAVVSSGKNNMYKLPNQEIIDKYQVLGPVYNTQNEGEIQFKVTKSGIKKTSRS